jgi:hypothetical protein
MLPNNLFGLKFGWCKHTRHVQATLVAHSLCLHCIFNFVVESKIVLGEMRSVECLVSKFEEGSHLGLLVVDRGTIFKLLFKK